MGNTANGILLPALLLCLFSIHVAAQPTAENSFFHVEGSTTPNEINYHHLNFDSLQRSSFGQKIFDRQNINHALLNACVFHFTNKYRMSRKLPPLNHNASLEAAANFHSSSMATQNFFAHENPRNRIYRTPANRAEKFGYEGNGVGENITLIHLKENSTYLDIANAIVESWIKSPPHRKNMLHRQYVGMGCGVALDADFRNGAIVKLFATQNFGG